MTHSMESFDLDARQLAELRAAHRRTRDKRQAYRLNAVILLGSGWSAHEVIQALLIDPDTVRRFYHRYKEGGVERLVKMDCRGSEPRLNDEQQKQLDAHLDEHIYLRVEDIIAHVERTFGVAYGLSGMTDLLHRMGFSYKKPKRVPGKADAEAQHKFIEEYEKLKENKGENDPIYFMDAVHPQHNAEPGWGWIKRGVDKPLPSNTGRRRLNINGAVEIEGMKVVTRTDETINAQSTIDLLRQIHRKHRKAETIYIICDNARYYRSKLVREFLESVNIKLVFLPAYAPNLNLIERLWKYFRREVLCNRYYETFADFVRACEEFFAKTVPKRKRKLRRLLRDNFQVLPQNACENSHSPGFSRGKAGYDSRTPAKAGAI